MLKHNPRAGAAPDVLPVWSWGLPLTTALVIGVLAAVLPPGDTYERVLRSEYGIIEIATLAACLVGFVLSLKLAWRGPDLPYPKSFRLYMLLFAAGFVFLFGEEASWGQHYIGWGTPDYFAEHNSMGETNLHNLTNAFEQVPKAILHIAAILGGLLWPLFLARRWSNGPEWLHWLMPTMAVVPSVVLGLGFRLWERILVWFNIEPVYTVIDKWKELKEGNELFLVYFLAIYVASLAVRTAPTTQSQRTANRLSAKRGFR